MDAPLQQIFPAKLRIIRDGAHDARFNMAADNYLLDCAANRGEVTLRTYSWNAPAITLGCMQKAEEILDAATMAAHGVSWVFRLTGGRAVLHWNDLTYSCTFPVSLSGMGRSIAESYDVIGRCLRAGLLHAGIATEMHDAPPEGLSAARNLRLPCFGSPSRNEIMVQGRKLIGSAQKRTSKAVLQHGSIPIGGEFRRLGEFMAVNSDEKKRLFSLLDGKCTWAGKIVPGIDRDALAVHIAKGFAEVLRFEQYIGAWTDEELSIIEANSKEDLLLIR
jgi:lipoate-protein ligase A